MNGSCADGSCPASGDDPSDDPEPDPDAADAYDAHMGGRFGTPPGPSWLGR